MSLNSSWRMLAISAAVAVMLSACSSSSDNSSGSSYNNGNGNGSGGAGISDNGGNGNGNGGNTGGETPPAFCENGTLADDGACTCATGTVLNAEENDCETDTRKPAAKGNDAVGPISYSGNTATFTLLDDAGEAVTGARDLQARITNENGEIQNSIIQVDEEGEATFTVEGNDGGHFVFEATDPVSGNTITGVVDPGSATDTNGKQIIGCHKDPKSPGDGDDDFKLSVDDTSVARGTGDGHPVSDQQLSANTPTKFGFTIKFNDAKGKDVSLFVDRTLKVTYSAFNGDEYGDITVNHPYGLSMKEGKAEYIYNIPSPGTDKSREFIVVVEDTACTAAENGNKDAKYTTTFTIAK